MSDYNMNICKDLGLEISNAYISRKEKRRRYKKLDKWQKKESTLSW